MKIYFCLPPSIYETIFVGDTKKELSKKLKRYFGRFELEFIYQNEITLINVIAMGKPILPSSENAIGQVIADAFKVNLADVVLKTDYARIDPNYCPKYDKPARRSPPDDSGSANGEFNYEKLSHNYTAKEPQYSFDQVVLSQQTMEQICDALVAIRVESKVFDEWGLRNIIPVSNAVLNFHGAPGTGKSMAAEAVAYSLGRKIIKATYADVESKFHGEGPKMVKALFLAAEREKAVLFLDESDSLLSKRLTSVTDGSSQAINSMRSQLLISLESFSGVVIFASNLVINYDRAFLSRLTNIEFKLPTEAERRQIWNNHLKGNGVKVPLGNDVDLQSLAHNYEFCGREIKKAVKAACIRAAANDKSAVSQSDLIHACDGVKNQKEDMKNSVDMSALK